VAKITARCVKLTDLTFYDVKTERKIDNFYTYSHENITNLKIDVATLCKDSNFDEGLVNSFPKIKKLTIFIGDNNIGALNLLEVIEKSKYLFSIISKLCT